MKKKIMCKYKVLVLLLQSQKSTVQVKVIFIVISAEYEYTVRRDNVAPASTIIRVSLR